MTDYHETRLDYLAGLTDSYPDFKITCSLPDFNVEYSHLENSESDEAEEFIAGRIYNIRYASKKLIFIDIQTGYSADIAVTKLTELNHLQILMNMKMYPDKEEFRALSKEMKRGDIVGFQGHPHRSMRGELSLVPTKTTILAPCLYELPHELKDPATRATQRYFDMIINYADSLPVFITRSRVISTIRRFMEDNLKLVEVETAMLMNQASGAAAKPFQTYHNCNKTNMFLRIATELNLKRLIVGGLAGVYEIGKQFRNEQVDQTHNPEFTSCEFYLPYSNYEDLMGITEQLLVTVSKAIGRECDCPFQTIPYRRIKIVPYLEEQLGEKFPAVSFSSEEMHTFLDKMCCERAYNCPEPRTNARLLETLIEEIIEPVCTEPTFVCDHPKIISPLAKSSKANPELTERFELFYNSIELCNAFTELNDPVEQRQRFLEQAKLKASGDEEACDLDEDFCRALEFGMPPTAGWGIGIDRLIMFLTGKTSIRDVILFPATRAGNIVIKKNDDLVTD